MKVLFISHQANRSGAPFALLQELRYIRRNCDDIQPIVLLLAKGELESEFKSTCPTVYWNNLELRTLRKLRIDRFLSKIYPIDCIYANSIVSLDIALITKQRLHCPLIVHTHESDSYLKRYINNPEKLRDVDSFITVSEYSKKCLTLNHGVSEDKVVIQRPFSPWIVKVIEGTANTLPVNRANNEFVIGSICNETWQKAPELIAIVANLFFKRYPDANCTFMIAGIGKGNDAHYRITYDLDRMHLENKVILMGRVERPLEYYPLFDVFLLLSREDSFPLVAEEAASSRLPIVGFENATGAAEWIKDGCGLLVPYLDLDALVDALYQLYINEDLRKQLGNHAKCVIEEMYHEESQMKKVIKVLQTVAQPQK